LPERGAPFWQLVWQRVVRSVFRVIARRTFGGTAMYDRVWLTREDLLACFSRIDAEGWDGPTARHLLDHLRRNLVRPQVSALRLRGPAAAQAEATGWETAWEILSRPYLRTTRNPMGVLWVAVRRAVRGEVVAARLASSDRNGWRWSPSGRPEDDPGELAARRYQEPLSLDALMQTDFDIPAPPMVAPLGRRLDAVMAAMVEEGWDPWAARRVVEAVAANAGLGRTRSTVAGGWRTLAHGIGLPPWQVRRVTVLLCGVPGWPGLMTVIDEVGRHVLPRSAVRTVIRATMNRRAPSAQSGARRLRV
jgi:hypothetical protein